jgi:cytidylate kinase
MSGRKIIVSIDGPAASGKSTAGKRLAAELDYLYIDSGALYRAVGLKAMSEGVPLDDGPALARMMTRTRIQPVRTAGGMRILLDGADVTEEIRGERMGKAASTVSARPEVRKALLQLQRDLGREGGVVMDGRDIGTVIFPGAEAKFYLDATAEERGRRRYLEMRAAGRKVSLEKVIEDIATRDRQDRNREHSPLRRAPGAFYLDTTGMDPDEVIQAMRKEIDQLTGA